jgi:hypothetical protein
MEADVVSGYTNRVSSGECTHGQIDLREENGDQTERVTTENEEEGPSLRKHKAVRRHFC